MSGRGKGGKGLGSSKKAKLAAPEAYSWTEGEEVAIVSLYSEGAVNAYVVAWGQLHSLIATALTAKRQHARPSMSHLGKRVARLDITLEDGDDNDDLFDYIKKSDVNDHREERGEAGDSDEEVEDRCDVEDEIRDWVFSKLDFWSHEPEVGVKVRGVVCFH